MKRTPPEVGSFWQEEALMLAVDQNNDLTSEVSISAVCFSLDSNLSGLPAELTNERLLPVISASLLAAVQRAVMLRGRWFFPLTVLFFRLG